MTVFERSTTIEAPFEAVWDFHSAIDGVETVTPGWMNLRVESAVGPDGESNPAVLEEGAEVSISIRPFGIAPREAWTSRIVDREREGERAFFRDRMLDGPFRRWVHTHRFRAVMDGTRMTDHVEYALKRPFDPVTPFGRPFLEVLFRERHRRAREALE